MFKKIVVSFSLMTIFSLYEVQAGEKPNISTFENVITLPAIDTIFLKSGRRRFVEDRYKYSSAQETKIIVDYNQKIDPNDNFMIQEKTFSDGGCQTEVFIGEDNEARSKFCAQSVNNEHRRKRLSNIHRLHTIYFINNLPPSCLQQMLPSLFPNKPQCGGYILQPGFKYSTFIDEGPCDCKEVQAMIQKMLQVSK